MQQRPVPPSWPRRRVAPALRVQLDSGRHVLRQALHHLGGPPAAPPDTHQPVHVRIEPLPPRPSPPLAGRAPAPRVPDAAPLAPLGTALPPVRQAALGSPASYSASARLGAHRLALSAAASPPLRLLQSLLLVRQGPWSHHGPALVGGLRRPTSLAPTWYACRGDGRAGVVGGGPPHPVSEGPPGRCWPPRVLL